MISDRIRQVLKERNFKQKQLAIGAGISTSTLNQILKNKYEPGVHTIRRIAEYLRIDLNWLITGKTIEERRKEQNIEISGDNISTGNIFIVKEGSINNERRSDYKNELMADIINKCNELDVEHRRAVLKVINTYVEIQQKLEGSKK